VSQPKNGNAPFAMTQVALDPPFFTRVTALCTSIEEKIFPNNLTWISLVKKTLK
jgi:hypothetical protein